MTCVCVSEMVLDSEFCKALIETALSLRPSDAAVSLPNTSLSTYDNQVLQAQVDTWK